MLHCWEVLGFVRLIPPKYEYLLTVSYIRGPIKEDPYIGFRILVRIWETEPECSGAVRSCLCYHSLDTDGFVVANALDAMFDRSSFLIRVCISISDGSVRFWEYSI